jgi:uncharacterized protein YdeI (YjbR/CyaY-like superfamily)
VVSAAQADGERVEPVAPGDWAAWLEANHRRAQGVWLVTWKKATGRQVLTYEDAVTEALRFGWIDAVGRGLDDERSMLWFAPRKPGSGWSGPNKQRIARLLAEGRMAPAGQEAVDRAQADGSWTKLDDVERLVVPPDLALAFDRHPGSGRRGRRSPGRSSGPPWSGSCRRSGPRPGPGGSTRPPDWRPSASGRTSGPAPDARGRGAGRPTDRPADVVTS